MPEQLGLHRKRLLALQRCLKLLLELQIGVFAALAQPLGLIQHHDGIVQIVGGRRLIVQQHRRQRILAVEAAARLQRVHGKGEVALHGAAGRAPRRAGLLVRRRLPEEILKGREVELALQLLLTAPSPARGAVPELKAQPARGQQPLLFLQERLRGGIEPRGRARRHGALGHHIEAADGVDLVVEELDAQRVGLAHGIHVQNAAAQGALAPRLHQLDALVARVGQLLHQLRRLHAHGVVDLNDVPAQPIRRHQPVHHRVRGQHQRRRFARGAVAQRLHAAKGHAVAGGRRLQKGQLPGRQAAHPAVQKQVQILRHAQRGHLVGHDHQRRAVQLPHRCGDEMRPLGVVRAVGRIDARPAQRVRQISKRVQLLQRAEQAAVAPDELLHTILPRPMREPSDSHELHLETNWRQASTPSPMSVATASAAFRYASNMVLRSSGVL